MSVLGAEVISGSSVVVSDVPIMGFYQTPQQSGGRIVVFGDSNCLDSAHLHRGNIIRHVKLNYWLWCVYVCVYICVCVRACICDCRLFLVAGLSLEICHNSRCPSPLYSQ